VYSSGINRRGILVLQLSGALSATVISGTATWPAVGGGVVGGTWEQLRTIIIEFVVEFVGCAVVIAFCHCFQILRLVFTPLLLSPSLLALQAGLNACCYGPCCLAAF
jgi:hypothetical protein